MQIAIASTGLLLLTLILRTHTASVPIVLISSRPTIALYSLVSRWAITVRGGGIALDTGSLRDASVANYHWSSTTYTNTIYAYNLNFHSTIIFPSYRYGRFLGFSVRGGYVTLSAGSLKATGYNSVYWSSMTYPNTTYAYYLDFASTNVNPSYYYDRFIGFSVDS